MVPSGRRSSCVRCSNKLRISPRREEGFAVDDPVLEKLTEFLRRLDVMERQLDELSRLLERYTALTKVMIESGAPPSPPPRIN